MPRQQVQVAEATTAVSQEYMMPAKTIQEKIVKAHSTALRAVDLHGVNSDEFRDALKKFGKRVGKLSDKQDLLPWATYSDIVTETQLLGVVLLGLYSQRVDTLATAIKCTMFVSLRACGPAVHRATGRAIVVALRNLLEHPLSKMHPLVLPAHNPLLAWAVIIIHRLLDLEDARCFLDMVDEGACEALFRCATELAAAPKPAAGPVFPSDQEAQENFQVFSEELGRSAAVLLSRVNVQDEDGPGQPEASGTKAARQRVLQAVQTTPGFLGAWKALWAQSAPRSMPSGYYAQALYVLGLMHPPLIPHMAAAGIEGLATDKAFRLICLGVEPSMPKSTTLSLLGLFVDPARLLVARYPEGFASPTHPPSPPTQWVAEHTSAGGLPGQPAPAFLSGTKFGSWRVAELKAFLRQHRVQEAEQCVEKAELVALCNTVMAVMGEELDELEAQAVAAEAALGRRSRSTTEASRRSEAVHSAASCSSADAAGSSNASRSAAGEEPAAAAKPPHPFTDLLPLDQACKKCAQCGANREQATLQKCSGCGRYWFCSKACQTEHWRHGHKRFCRSFQELQAWIKARKDEAEVFDMGEPERERFLPVLWAVQPELARAIAKRAAPRVWK